uniref:Uncharacterized protein n=1 Tax=Chromera velia CCMP2878 TaxID=1169474 RepID=A0A0G4F6M3_9ALVE|eukprot:Cvel_15467.t1-p1 / transcript=Cvel_15467.t1 / gene=Cvel_15467 / organism=Chromera_velia_CCMP2878 / gene_product=hypothetical protein / transcript_product=hypothetical protein / location=Cvel_scaffold1146:13535-18126(+) / protein_length=771 / sequence_SO=supercontig / SO=protein_coding / is_pseudo=false
MLSLYHPRAAPSMLWRSVPCVSRVRGQIRCFQAAVNPSITLQGLEGEPFVAFLEQMASASDQEGRIENVKTDLGLRQSWFAAAKRANELAPRFSAAQVGRICGVFRGKKRKYLPDLQLHWEQFANKTASSLKTVDDTQLSDCVGALCSAKLVRGELLKKVTDEVSERLTSLPTVVLIDLAESLLLVRQQREGRGDEGGALPPSGSLQSLFPRLSGVLLPKLDEVADTEHLSRAVYAIASLQKHPQTTLETLKKRLQERLKPLPGNAQQQPISMRDLKMVPSAMAALGSQDPSLYKAALDIFFVRLNSDATSRDFFTFFRRSFSLPLHPSALEDSSQAAEPVETERDGGGGPSAASVFASRLLSDAGALDWRGVIVVAEGLSMLSFRVTRKNRMERKTLSRLCNAFVQNCVQRLTKRQQQSGEGKGEEDLKENAELLFHASEFVLRADNPAIAQIGRQVKYETKRLAKAAARERKSLGKGNEGTAALQMMAVSLVFCVASLSKNLDAFTGQFDEGVGGTEGGLMLNSLADVLDTLTEGRGGALTGVAFIRLTKALGMMRHIEAEVSSRFAQVLDEAIRTRAAPFVDPGLELPAEKDFGEMGVEGGGEELFNSGMGGGREGSLLTSRHAGEVLSRTGAVFRQKGVPPAAASLWNSCLVVLCHDLKAFPVGGGGRGPSLVSSQDLPPGVNQQTLADAVEAVGALLEELPFGSPLKTSAVGCLAVVARRLCFKNAFHIPSRRVSEALVEAMPSDAEEALDGLLKKSGTTWGYKME